MSVFITADTHFGHKNLILNYRKFNSIEEHDELIVANWNKVVNKRDLTFILGDITMEHSNYSILSRLNGRIAVVLGNHDERKHVRELLKYVDNVAGAIDYRGFVLTHIPINLIELSGRYMGNIHGHTHRERLNDPRYINVCMDVSNFTPIPFDLIKKPFMEEFEKRKTLINFNDKGGVCSPF